MERVWITNGSTSVAPVVNSLDAACHRGYLPTDVFLLSNPGVEDVVDSAVSMAKTIVTAHGGDEPTVAVESVDEELDFEGIVSYLTGAIEAARGADAEVAVDVTPGRKFWSIISFQAGHEYGVDHLYYGHVKTDAYYGTPYPAIPRTAVELVDFTEVL